jgi:hypothetical protein
MAVVVTGSDGRVVAFSSWLRKHFGIAVEHVKEYRRTMGVTVRIRLYDHAERGRRVRSYEIERVLTADGILLPEN